MKEDIALAESALANLPADWDGKQCVLELKEANYNWRQMEGWAFYFEYQCRANLKGIFDMPGEKIGKVKFDAKRTINWDFKAKAIKSDDHRAILNDTAAMDSSIRRYGSHGLIIAMCDVEYNDDERSFQKWHEELKGGKSKYEIGREQRTALSRYRKTRVILQEILFLTVSARNVRSLEIHHQGRNSNGRPRPPKYMLNFDLISRFLVDRLDFTA
ncbi:MAG TPA: hypothetical protein VIK33_08700 [Anaerolineae bacterium]